MRFSIEMVIMKIYNFLIQAPLRYIQVNLSKWIDHSLCRQLLKLKIVGVHKLLVGGHNSGFHKILGIRGDYTRRNGQNAVPYAADISR